MFGPLPDLTVCRPDVRIRQDYAAAARLWWVKTPLIRGLTPSATIMAPLPRLRTRGMFFGDSLPPAPTDGVTQLRPFGPDEIYHTFGVPLPPGRKSRASSETVLAESKPRSGAIIVAEGVSPRDCSDSQPRQAAQAAT